VFGGGEVNFAEAAGELGGGFPADLATETGFIAGGIEAGKVFEEMEEDGFEEVPIFGTGGEEGAEEVAPSRSNWLMRSRWALGREAILPLAR
jgi:hypothetical protein